MEIKRIKGTETNLHTTNEMIMITQQQNEARIRYLVRVAIEMLRENADHMDYIHYDDAECDAGCLADDLEHELNSEDQ